MVFFSSSRSREKFISGCGISAVIGATIGTALAGPAGGLVGFAAGLVAYPVVAGVAWGVKLGYQMVKEALNKNKLAKTENPRTPKQKIDIDNKDKKTKKNSKNSKADLTPSYLEEFQKNPNKEGLPTYEEATKNRKKIVK